MRRRCQRHRFAISASWCRHYTVSAVACQVPCSPVIIVIRPRRRLASCVRGPPECREQAATSCCHKTFIDGRRQGPQLLVCRRTTAVRDRRHAIRLPHLCLHFRPTSLANCTRQFRTLRLQRIRIYQVRRGARMLLPSFLRFLLPLPPLELQDRVEPGGWHSVRPSRVPSAPQPGCRLA